MTHPKQGLLGWFWNGLMNHAWTCAHCDHIAATQTQLCVHLKTEHPEDEAE